MERETMEQGYERKGKNNKQQKRRNPFSCFRNFSFETKRRNQNASMADEILKTHTNNTHKNNKVNKGKQTQHLQSSRLKIIMFSSVDRLLCETEKERGWWWCNRVCGSSNRNGSHSS